MTRSGARAALRPRRRAPARALQEIGRTLNVTRERIRQIEHQSREKLQNVAETQKLRDDVEISYQALSAPTFTTRHRYSDGT